jgi:pyrroloquinoline quinone biosynthesis protein D
MNSGTPRPLIRLASGFHLQGGEEAVATLVLVCPDGNVQLNQIAAGILRLCDGTRSREKIISQILTSNRNHGRATEITEFLDAAMARGWIDEN